MGRVLTSEQRTTIDEAVRNVSAAGIVVRGVDIEERDEPDEQYIRVSVELSRPAHETWATDDFYLVRRRVHEAVVESVGTGVNLQVTYRPEPGPGDEEIGPGDEIPDPGSKPAKADTA